MISDVIQSKGIGIRAEVCADVVALPTQSHRDEKQIRL